MKKLQSNKMGNPKMKLKQQSIESSPKCTFVFITFTTHHPTFQTNIEDCSCVRYRKTTSASEKNNVKKLMLRALSLPTESEYALDLDQTNPLLLAAGRIFCVVFSPGELISIF